MQPYRRTLVALALLMFMLAACAGTPRPRGDTPEAAVEQLLRQAPDTPPNTQPHLQVHGTRNTPHGVVVLYTAAYRTADGQLVAAQSSYALLERLGKQWSPVSATFNPPPTPYRRTYQGTPQHSRRAADRNAPTRSIQEHSALDEAAGPAFYDHMVPNSLSVPNESMSRFKKRAGFGTLWE